MRGKMTWKAIGMCTGLAGLVMWGAGLLIVRLSPYLVARYHGKGANLTRASLILAPLRGAVLEEACLRGADLRGADLADAYLGGADLSYADLRGANLDAALCLICEGDGRQWPPSIARFSGARYDSRTRWPEGFDPQKHGAVLEEENAQRRSTSMETRVMASPVARLESIGGSSTVASRRQIGLGRKPMQVVRKGDSIKVTLDPAVQQAVRRHFPGCRLARLADFDQEVIRYLTTEKRAPFAPFAVTGDFDGNKLPDIGLMLINRRERWLLVALHQQRQGGFRPYTLNRWKASDIWEPGYKNRSYIELSLPGRFDYVYTASNGQAGVGSIWLKHDTISHVFPEEVTVTFYFSRGRYRSIAND